MGMQIVSFTDFDTSIKMNEPAKINLENIIPQQFHYWRGNSGKRYLHTVYSLVECPEMEKANYILVKNNPNGTRTAIHIGQTTMQEGSLNLASIRQLGAAMGANEVHLHVLADDCSERNAVEHDLRSGLFTNIS